MPTTLAPQMLPTQLPGSKMSYDTETFLVITSIFFTPFINFLFIECLVTNVLVKTTNPVPSRMSPQLMTPPIRSPQSSKQEAAFGLRRSSSHTSSQTFDITTCSPFLCNPINNPICICRFSICPLRLLCNKH